MAVLESVNGDKQRTIPPRLLIGRSPSCGLQLEDRHVSGEHATISWTGKHWEVRDLGSRNGTYIDGTRIESGHNVRLLVGTRLAFGDLRSAWTVVDDDAPSIMAVHADSGLVQSGSNDLLLLPNDERPEASIYADIEGWWWIEDGEQSARKLQHQQTVSTSVGAWTVLLPTVGEGTPLLDAQIPFDAIELRFSVDRCEERVRVSFVAYGIEKHLAEREHGYVLLTLARARLADKELSADQRGWRNRDELERLLRIDSNTLNVAIHRARHQLSAAGVDNAAKLVEVRPRHRRLGTDRVRVSVRSSDE